MNPRYDVVLFDLDGTLIDSEPGVHGAVRHALLEGFGIAATTAELDEFMGPALDEVMPRVFGISDRAEIHRFFELYCEAYFHDMEYDFEPYPGVFDLVRDIRAAGTTVGLATAKPHESATRILESAGVLGCFDYVAGSQSDGSRQDKGEVVAHALEALGVDRGKRVAMVGDRAVDVRAARLHGLDAVGVEWGYGPDGEFDGTLATYVVGDAGELRAVLLG